MDFTTETEAIEFALANSIDIHQIEYTEYGVSLDYNYPESTKVTPKKIDVRRSYSASVRKKRKLNILEAYVIGQEHYPLYYNGKGYSSELDDSIIYLSESIAKSAIYFMNNPDKVVDKVSVVDGKLVLLRGW